MALKGLILIFLGYFLEQITLKSFVAALKAHVNITHYTYMVLARACKDTLHRK